MQKQVRVFSMWGSGFLVFLCVLFPLPSRGENCAVDLTHLTTDNQTQYILAVGQVETPVGMIDRDLAVCLATRGGSRLGTVVDASVVALASSGNGGECLTASTSSRCDGEGCQGFDIIVDSPANITLGTTDDVPGCLDTNNLFALSGAATSSREMVAIHPVTDSSLSSLRIYNMQNDGEMGLTWDMERGGPAPFCTIPSDDQDARFGLGYIHSGSYWVTFWDLYVCSEAVRVCSYTNSYMQTSFVNIYGNTLNNTIRHCGSGDYDSLRYCDSGAYYVYGWRSGIWTSGTRLYGYAGHDWLQGSPEEDYLYGGSGNDLVDGGGGDMNMVYGEDGRDSLHSSGEDGRCDGGNPEPGDNECVTWQWPYTGTTQGDCCCSSCNDHNSCSYQDMGHGWPASYDPW